MTKDPSKKVLLQDNAIQATSFIESLETVYIPAIRTLISGLKHLGITDPDKVLICEIISENYSNLEAKYLEIVKADILKFSTPASQKRASDDANGFLQDFLQEIKTRLVQFVDYKGRSMSLSDTELQQYWILDESGNPIIASAVKEAISENFKTYASDPSHIKVVDLQQKAAQSLSDLLKAMKTAGFMEGYFPPTPWLALSQIFEVSMKADYFVIEPKTLSFPELNDVSQDSSTEPMVEVPREAKDVLVNKRFEQKDKVINKKR